MIPKENLEMSFEELALKGKEILTQQPEISYEQALAQVQRLKDMSVVNQSEKRNRPEISQPDLTKLRPVLFWDTDIQKIDWEKQKRAVIQRVFARGSDQEKAEITRFYGSEVINQYI